MWKEFAEKSQQSPQTESSKSISVCVCPCSPAGVPRSALQTAHGDLQHCLPEEELNAALQLHSEELQPDTTSQVKTLTAAQSANRRQWQDLYGNKKKKIVS